MNLSETSHTFNLVEDDHGYKSFVPLGDLCDSSRGFIMNDTCIIEVHMLVQKIRTRERSC